MLIYLAQLTHEFNAIPQNKCFPLAIGLIAEYLKKQFGNKVEVKVFKSVKELNAAFLYRKPHVLMLSNYLWNEKLICEFANEVKLLSKDILVIVGGPNVSLEISKQIGFLKNNPAIDIYVFAEGEKVSAALLKKFMETNEINEVKKLNLPYTMAMVDNKILIGEFENIDEPNKVYTLTLSDIPSPYLSGLFDKLFKNGEIPLIESSRGCPFSCTFCQTGRDYYNKIRHHSSARIAEEIQYIAEKINREKLDIYSLEITDQNLGMYQRDEKVFDCIRKAQDKYDFPKVIGCSTGKNKIRFISQNILKLKKGSMMLRCAIQSMNYQTLKAVKRENIKLESFLELQKELDDMGIECNADLMLGLPQENRETHCHSIYKLIDAGIKEFSCLQTIILKGTELEKGDYRHKYGIVSKYRVIPGCYNEYKILSKTKFIYEIEEIVIQTNTMSFDDYLKCRKLHLLLMVYHNTRLLDLPYKYLDSLGIKRSEVLRKLYQHNHNGLNQIVNSFLEDTENELFTDANDIYNKDIKVTYNKLFRYLAIAFLKNKNIVVEALRDVLLQIIDASKVNEINELLKITKARMIDPSQEIVNSTLSFHSNLSKIFGENIELYLSDTQEEAIKLMNSIYRDYDDKINNMIYALRPVNLCLKIKS